MTDAEMASARAALLHFDGLDAEFSSCAGVMLPLPNPETAIEDTVCIITASGYKHTFADNVPTAELVLWRRYGFEISWMVASRCGASLGS